MSEVALKPKITLKKKGESTEVAINKLLITLSWKTHVDLDLMVFFKTKDGREGGVFSSMFGIPDSEGSLEKFPWMQTAGDVGVGEEGGGESDEEMNEEVKIAKLDDMSIIYICTLNYADAIDNKSVSFSEYDAVVNVKSDAGHNLEVPLDSEEKGHMAVICKIDNTKSVARLINENRILTLPKFLNEIPGAKLILNG